MPSLRLTPLVSAARDGRQSSARGRERASVAVMDRRPFGPTGASVVRVGLGTWQMEGDDRKDCVAALRAGLDAGMTHVDTAELYGSGRVEEIVAEAIEGRRDSLY